MTPVLGFRLGYITKIDGISYGTIEPLSDDSMLIRLTTEQSEQLKTCDRVRIDQLEAYQFYIPHV